jgi:hypothetical protein
MVLQPMVSTNLHNNLASEQQWIRVLTNSDVMTSVTFEGQEDMHAG